MRTKRHREGLIVMASFSVLLIGYWILSPGTMMPTIPLVPDKTTTVSLPLFDDEKDAGIDKPFALTSIEQTVFPDLICSIADYGAIGDGVSKNTASFEQAISDCAKQGGGQVLVPAGKWLTGPIHFKSNINLHLASDAEIVFSTDYSDYLPVVFSRFEGVEYYNYSPPIYANNCKNIAITGTGTINGSGKESWWNLHILASIPKLFALGKNSAPLADRVFGTPEDGLRPTFIEFVNSKNILIEDVTLTNGPMWTMHPLYSSDIVVRRVTVNTSPGKSTDGIDIDSSRNVLVEDSTFNTGDDAIVIKSGRDEDGWRVGKPSENIVIRRNTVKDSHAAFAIGSEMSGDVRNVLIYNCRFLDSQYGFRLKGTLVSGGIVENISAQNITMDNLQFAPIQITTNYEVDLNVGTQTPPTFRDITLRDIRATRSSGSISMLGLDGTVIDGVQLENITIDSRHAPILENVSHINFTGVTVTAKDIAHFTDAKNIILTDYTCPKKTTTCLVLDGADTTGIDIAESGILPTKIQFTNGANSEALQDK